MSVDRLKLRIAQRKLTGLSKCLIRPELPYLFEFAFAGLFAAGAAGRAFAEVLPDEAAFEFDALAAPVFVFAEPPGVEAVFAAGVGGIAILAPLNSLGLSTTF